LDSQNGGDILGLPSDLLSGYLAQFGKTCLPDILRHRRAAQQHVANWQCESQQYDDRHDRPDPRILVPHRLAPLFMLKGLPDIR
jgi:hypothetical protein